MSVEVELLLKMTVVTELVQVATKCLIEDQIVMAARHSLAWVTEFLNTWSMEVYLHMSLTKSTVYNPVS